MCGPAPPEITGKQRFKLRRDEAHLRWQLHALLANVFEIRGEFLVEEDHCFAVHHSVLSAAERKHVHTYVRGDLLQSRAKTNCCIRETSTVDVQQHAVIMCEAGERL